MTTFNTKAEKNASKFSRMYDYQQIIAGDTFQTR